jgi:hypothetical protein
VPLLIIDNFGLKPLRPPADEDLHELTAERYETTYMIVTSKLDLPEWDRVSRQSTACFGHSRSLASTRVLPRARRHVVSPTETASRNQQVTACNRVEIHAFLGATISDHHAELWRLHAGKSRFLYAGR